MQNSRPKIGIALSGGASRAVAHIAVLEVLTENNIPIDYLVGCSSGALVAVAYAAGTMEYLKQWIHSNSIPKMIRMWSMKNAKGGLFHFGKGEEDIRKIAGNLTFETAHPKLGLVASELSTGKLVTLSMGDVFTAIKASCAVPGLFEPVVWGDKILVDGGLASIVPTAPLSDMGADIVIGVNISPSKFIYEGKLPAWKRFRTVTRWWGLNYLIIKPITFSRKLFFKLVSEQGTGAHSGVKLPRSYQVLMHALDRSMEISEEFKDREDFSHLMISPKVKQYKRKEFDHLDEIYAEGRRSAVEALPKIRKLIADWQSPTHEDRTN